jgi:hypothetical protein
VNCPVIFTLRRHPTKSIVRDLEHATVKKLPTAG